MEAEHWTPLDSLTVAAQSSIYSIGPVDADRIPVLFIHGMNGSPANFAYLADRLDRSRYQAWVYDYRSGARLEALGGELDEALGHLWSQHRIDALAIVAHSVGGLIARDLILRHAHDGRAGSIPLLVTISTPWEGHEAAQYAPPFVDRWRDIVPGSPYLRGLFAAPLPASTHHYLLFTFKRGRLSYGASGDRTVTVASQLPPLAQREARRVVGFDDTHDGVLRNPEVSALLDRVLDETFTRRHDRRDSAVTAVSSSANDSSGQRP